jgi:hypothetical protein
MESNQQSQARDMQYEAPAGVELGTLAEMTAGNKGGSSGDYTKGCTFPSNTR